MGETKLLKIILLSTICQTTLGRPFSFPDGTRANGDSRSRQNEQLEGRSILGGYSQDNKPDIYSRYNVYEHEEEDYRRTSTTHRPYVTFSTTRQAHNRAPNAHFNRLPPAKNDEPIEAEPEDDYDDDGDAQDGVDPPPTNAAADFSSSSSGNFGSNPVTFNNLLYNFNANNKFGGFGNLFGENRHKYKHKFKRRKPGQPCIPYDLFNRLRTGRDSNGNRIDPKTLIPPLNLVLADVNYYSPSNNYNGHGVASDTGSPGHTGGAVFNNHFYDAVGGYPCTGGYKPINRPHGGPLGFFGQGGLFDWTTSADSVQSDPGEGGGTGNKPTVVFNLNDAIDTVATNWRPGESFQMMMKVIAEFISSVAGGAPVAAGEAVGDAVDTVRKVNKEFVSLFS
ncbi:uncharacterized protein LOC115260368 [Aedes albopictus]|uniref:Secreted protein n=1 Tax=Aedes albopictus TaxID=7160 RepID=A0ABM2A2E9_AEDAL